MPVDIHIQNFQSIKDSSIHVEGLTAVTGQNNTGKTALMRAVRGVFQNTPGNHYIRHGTDECTVTVTLKDVPVSWSKSLKGKPKYVLPGRDPIFPGREIPTPVAELGITPVEIGSETVWPNFAPQFTGQVFLLDKPGSALAEAVSDVERVHLLNDALRKAQAAKKAADDTAKDSRAAKVGVEDSLRGYLTLDSTLAEITRCQSLMTEAEACKARLSTLEALQVRIQNTKAVLQALSGIQAIPTQNLDILNAPASVCGVRKRLNNALKEVAQVIEPLQGVQGLCTPSLDGLVGGVSRVQELSRLQGGLGRVPPPPPDLEMPDLGQGKDLLAALQTVGNLAQRHSESGRQISSTEGQLKASRQQAEEAATDLDAALKEVGYCPTCGDIHD